MSELQVVPAEMERLHRFEETAGLLKWITSVDHKQIGIMYVLATLMFFLFGGVEALLMRIQLSWPGMHFLAPETYDQLFTLHGTTMIFLVVMPLLIGIGVYVVPLQIGARDMAFPRLNALSFWLFLFGGLLLYFSVFYGNSPDAGWFAYAPLTEKPYSMMEGMSFWCVGLLTAGIGTVASGINFIVTVATLRARGMSLNRLPLFTWMTLVNSFIILGALPALNASQVMLLLDRELHTRFFNPTGGGSPILWQHFFWNFGHPEVYILIIPAWGMLSEVIPVFSRKPIFGYTFVAASTVAIALLSFWVWGHHMFAVGLGHWPDIFFAATSALIAVPTGIKIFAWIGTMWGGAIRFTTSMMFAVAFLIQFTMGGVTGIMFAVVPIDWQLTDTYFVVAHLHYVLFGGTLFAVFSGLYYWFPKMSGRMLSERIGRWHFWLTVIGFNATFFVQHIVGAMGMTRRVWTYPNLPRWAVLNLISSIGAFVLGFSVLIFLWNLWVSAKRGEPAGPNPWDAWTLEWATTSPPPEYNFREIPPVHGRRPLWDLQHPESEKNPKEHG